MGAKSAGSSRPDAEPTINEAGQQGFAVDGTDSFSVPGPGDGLPPDPGDEDAVARVAAMRRLLVTLGAAVAVLLVVIIVGRTGGSGSGDRLAGTEQRTPFSLPSPFGEPSGRSSADREASDERADATFTTYDAEFTSPSSGTVSSEYDSGYDGTFPPYTVTSDPYDDDQFSDFPDYQSSPYVPSRTTPRVFPRYTPPVIRSQVPDIEGDDTEEPDETDPEETTPETDATTTTSTSTTTSTTTTTTTTVPPAPASAWKAPTTPLGVVCGDQLRLWAGHQSVLAAVGTARVWRSTDGGATWSGLTLGVPTAYADDPTDPATAWVATSTGVSKVVAGTPSALGGPAGVTSLSAAGAQGAPTLVALSDGQVQRWVDATTGWKATEALPTGAVPGEVLALDGDSFLVGTDDGIAHSDDGGSTYVMQAAGVIGTPVRTGEIISWLLADRSGVARSIDGGTTWNVVRATGIATDATTLAEVPGLGLVTTGVGDKALVSWTSGAAWAPLTDQPSFRPDGIARAGSGGATAVWTSHCVAGGQPSAADAVLRLADP